jgi:predicted RNase H-like HicB family nuclease
MEKNLKFFMGLNYPVTVEKYTDDDEIYYSLEIPDLPGCGSYGATLEEAFERLEESKELWLSESLKRGLDISEPVSEDDFSGKFLIRIPSRLHMKISKNAKARNLSLNQHIKSLLEQSEISDRINSYLERNIKIIIESQNKNIARLEKKLESLEKFISSQYSSLIRYQTEYVNDSPTTALPEVPAGYTGSSTGLMTLTKDFCCQYLEQ